MTDTIKDFIGIFPNAADKEYCDILIHRLDYLKELQNDGRGGRKRIWSRQEAEDGISSMQKEDDTYFLGEVDGDAKLLTEEDVIVVDTDIPLLRAFDALIWRKYDTLAKKYGILRGLALHKTSSSVRIQKTKPTQGYHIWHCDSDSVYTSRRMMAVILYLNTVEEGGETEFLHQSMRVPPVQGTLILFPSAWTHPHRGNPPLKGNKYIMTTWLEFME